MFTRDNGIMGIYFPRHLSSLQMHTDIFTGLWHIYALILASKQVGLGGKFVKMYL